MPDVIKYAQDRGVGVIVDEVPVADGATVASPVTVKMAATNFTIEPAGDGTVKEGAGHFHIARIGERDRPGVACIAEGHAGSAQEIRDWMSGNLCRCGAYRHIFGAVAHAAELRKG